MDRETVDEIKRHFGIVVEDVRSDVHGVAESVDALRDEMHREVSTTRSDLGQQISSVGAALMSTREELGARIQGMADDGRALHEEFKKFRGNVAEEFEETRALVRLSYGQLDRRVRTLETEMADIRERLERVEGRIAG